MTRALIVESGAATHPGTRRVLNEDAYMASDPVFLVADGMGGHDAGDLASAAVIAEFHPLAGRPSLLLDDVREALGRAREAVDSLADAGGGRAGTTLSGVVLAAVDGTGYWLALNIGDSRTYRFAGGELEQISVDHSVVQEMVDAGELSAHDAAIDRRRNIITRAIGAGSSGDADYWLFPAERGDRMLVCSDGLSAELSDEAIREILLPHGDPQTTADALVDAAVRAGGRDNVTAIVVDAVAVASRPGRPLEIGDDVDEDTRPRAIAGGKH